MHREEQRLRDAVLDRGNTACIRLSDAGVELKLHGSGRLLVYGELELKEINLSDFNLGVVWSYG